MPKDTRHFCRTRRAPAEPRQTLLRPEHRTRRTRRTRQPGRILHLPAYPGYPGYGPQPQGAVYPYYAGPVAPSTNGFAIASLILSISGFVLLGIVGSVLGVIFGHVAQGQIKRAVPPQEGQGLASAGTIMGYIGIGLNLILLIGILIFVFLIPIIAVGNGGSTP